MNRSMPKAARALSQRLPRRRGDLAAFLALLLLAVPLAGRAEPASVSAPVEEHLVAQAGLSIATGMNLVAQFFTLISSGTSCAIALGGNVHSYYANSVAGPGTSSLLNGVYYDTSCLKPFFIDSIEQSSTTLDYLVHTAHFLAPNGALLGVLSLAEQFGSVGSEVVLNGKGTYKAVAGAGAPAVRLGLACSFASVGGNEVLTCQEGIAQDFPALKMALGTINNVILTIHVVGPDIDSVALSGSSAKLVTGKLGGLSLTLSSPTTLAFQGTNQVVGTGTTGGGSPIFSMIQPSTTHWSFNDGQHATKFSISTGNNLHSTGTVVNSTTHATTNLQVDQSGTGTIAYSDKSKAKITNWVLSD